MAPKKLQAFSERTMRLGIRAAKIRVRLMNEAPGGIKRGPRRDGTGRSKLSKTLPSSGFHLYEGPRMREPSKSRGRCEIEKGLGPMKKDRQGAMDALAKDIRRQIATSENARLLKRIPLFRVDYSTPRYMQDLLGQLERQEATGRSGSK